MTHAGGIVFRHRDGELRYLIVSAADNPAHYVLPKGHIEAGESAAEAAIREIREEAGVEAEILRRVGQIEFRYKQKDIVAVYYLCRYLRETTSRERRRVLWRPFAECMKRLSFENSRELLGRAHALVGELRKDP